MTNTYAQYGKPNFTPQSQPLEGQVKNSAGGYSYAVDKWALLERFLILGSEGGTYYIKEEELTERNAKNLIECIKEDANLVVHILTDISNNGRAVRNTPALFALAMVQKYGTDKDKQLAYTMLSVVARTGYHWLMWAQYSKNLAGTGMGWRKAVARLLNNMDENKLAYQFIKYQQREGMSQRDLLRLAHPKPEDTPHDLLYQYVTKGWTWMYKPDGMPDIIWNAEIAKTAGVDKIAAMARDGLPREAIPTQHLNDIKVWEALLPSMPLHATVRNLGKMTSIGLIKPMSDAEQSIVEKLSSQDYIHRSRLHPLSILVALKTYSQGKGMRGSLNWSPSRAVLDALDKAFYMSFANVEPSRERYLLALDVSGSMNVDIAGLPLSAREAASAMAMVVAATEPAYHTIAFTSNGSDRPFSNSEVIPFNISPRERLDDIIRRTNGLPFRGTDCALPMIYADKEGMLIDKFVVITDSETWAGDIHPSEALRQYRRKWNAGAKLIVVATTSNGFSIADPNDLGMLDVVGFDTTVPQVISSF